MLIETKQISEISSTLSRQLCSMTYRTGSLMRQAFLDLRTRLYERMGNYPFYPHQGVVFLCFEGDILVGWALSHRQKCKITKKYETLGMLWVKNKYRRKGYGTALYKAMLDHPNTLENFQVIPHDYDAKMFFRSFGITWTGKVNKEGAQHVQLDQKNLL